MGRDDEPAEPPADMAALLERLCILEKRVHLLERRQATTPPPLASKLETLRGLVEPRPVASVSVTPTDLSSHDLKHVPPVSSDVPVHAPDDTLTRALPGSASQASAVASTHASHEAALRTPGDAVDPPPPAAPDLVSPAPQTVPAPTEAVLQALQVAPQDFSPPPLPPQRPRVLGYEPQRKKKPALAQGSLEQTIGLKWAGWVGAVVLVIGAGLGIKFAYDQGWLGGLPATAKLVILWLLGFSLIGVGEYVYRRVNKMSAAGLYGAGVALLFLVSYAGHGYFGLYARDTAFVLMGVSTLVGSAVAMRGRLVSIGVLSLIGGHVAPIILGGEVNSVAPFLSYLAGLQCVALVLAWWGGTRPWWTLRTFSLIANTLWMVVVVTSVRDAKADQIPTLLIFLLGFAGLYQLELILSAFKRAACPPTSVARVDDHAGVVFSVFVTALLTIAILFARGEATDSVRGTWVLGLAVAHTLLGFALTSLTKRSNQSEKQTLPHPAYGLAVGYRVQATVLLIVAVPVALTGVSVLIGWAAMSVALGLLGARLDLPIARRGAAVTWLLSVGYLILWTTGQLHPAARADEVWITLFDHALPAYWFSAIGLTLIGHVVAQLMLIGRRGDDVPQQQSEMRTLAGMLNAVAAFVVIVASVSALPPLGATGMMAVYAWFLFGADILFPGRGLLQLSAAVVALAVVKWAVVDCLTDRMSPHWSAAAHVTLFNPMMGVGAFLSFTLVAIGWLRRDTLMRFGSNQPDRGHSLTLLQLATAVLVIMTIGLTFEVDRQIEASQNPIYEQHLWHLKQLAWTMLWSVALAAQFGLVNKLGPLSLRTQRHCNTLAALALLVAGKFLLLDTLAFRLLDGPVALSLVANFQRLAAVVVLCLLMLARALTHTGDRARSTLSAVAGFGVMLVTLWILSFEIDGLAQSQTLAPPWIFRQVGWSICWSIFAVLCVGIGFGVRQAPLRYFGLALFGATLLKVTFIDLSAASTGYRILSFVGLGALLLGTSVLYGKVSPVLLGLTNSEASDHPA